MTDFERFKELYDNLGVKYEKSEPYSIIIHSLDNPDKIDEGFTEIFFDENGKFRKQCFWE